MDTVVLSIKIRRVLKEKMDRFRDVDWGKEIETFIESKLRELELKQLLSAIDEALKNVAVAKESAWETIREFREANLQRFYRR